MKAKQPGKTHVEAFNDLIIKLQKLYSASESREIARRLVEYVSDKPFTWILAHPYSFQGLEKEKLWKKFEKRLLNATPIQYVTGKAWFYGYPFRVNRSVLIPRQETEELVDWIIKDYEKKPGIRVLDVCSGSGCIAVTLARSLDIICMAIEKSEIAIEVARENALLLEEKVDFRQMDIFEARDDDFSKIAVLVANPPYIPESEKAHMHPNVLNFEPEEALFIPDEDPLIFYRKIAELGKTWLVKGGRLYFEINERFGKEVVELLESEGYVDVQLRKDLNGKDRMIRAEKPADMYSQGQSFEIEIAGNDENARFSKKTLKKAPVNKKEEETAFTEEGEGHFE